MIIKFYSPYAKNMHTTIDFSVYIYTANKL